jgi:ubiquinone/menaquinone biosynthesis C-methylase UbiE
MPLFDHFSVLSPIYDRLFRRDEATPLIALADLPVEGRLLDAAGGTGRIAANLVGNARSLTVADASPGMLHQAKSKTGLQTVAAQIEALPFPPACFDRVVMVDAFHHLADQQRGLEEMWRTLAPGGRVVIEEPDIAVFAVKLIALVERALLMRSRFRPAGDIAAGLDRLGGEARIVRQDHAYWVIGVKTAGPTAGGWSR